MEEKTSMTLKKLRKKNLEKIFLSVIDKNISDPFDITRVRDTKNIFPNFSHHNSKRCLG